MKDQKGFGAAGMVAVLTVVSVIGFAGWRVYESSQDTENESSSTQQIESNNEEESRSDSSNSLTTDSHRKNDAARFATEASNFQANNNGKVPTYSEAKTDLINRYILYNNDLEFNDPTSGVQYVIVEGDPKIGEIQYVAGATCENEDIVTGSSRQFAVRIVLESGKYYCAG